MAHELLKSLQECLTAFIGELKEREGVEAILVSVGRESPREPSGAMPGSPPSLKRILSALREGPAYVTFWGRPKHLVTVTSEYKRYGRRYYRKLYEKRYLSASEFEADICRYRKLKLPL